MYEGGYIVTLQHDTIQGYVYFPSEDDIRSKIMFKKIQNETPALYTPENILAFGLNTGESFRSVTYTYYKKDDISEEGEQISEKCFARVLLDADYKLYRLTFAMVRNDFVYIIEKEDKFYVIRAAKDAVGDPTKKIAHKDIALLNYLLGTCSDMEVKTITNTKYEDAQMIKLLSQYSTCVLPDLNQQKYPSKMKLIVQPFVYAGYANIRYKTWLPEKTYSTNLAGYSLGAFLDLLIPRISKRNAVTIGAQYIRYEKKSGFRPDLNWNWSADFSLFYNFFLVNNDIHQLCLFLGWSGYYSHSSSDYGSSFYFPEPLPSVLGASYRYQNVGTRLTIGKVADATVLYWGLSYYFK